MVLFDLSCAEAHAVLMVKARGASLALATAEGYIAAIVAASGFVAVTRDIGPLEAVGANGIDPRVLARA